MGDDMFLLTLSTNESGKCYYTKNRSDHEEYGQDDVKAHDDKTDLIDPFHNSGLVDLITCETHLDQSKT